MTQKFYIISYIKCAVPDKYIAAPALMQRRRQCLPDASKGGHSGINIIINEWPAGKFGYFSKIIGTEAAKTGDTLLRRNLIKPKKTNGLGIQMLVSH